MALKRSSTIFSGLLAFAVAGASTGIAATPTIVATTTNLLPNTANQTIQFMITGLDSIAGEDLNIEINSGTSGPTLGSVDILTNTIFQGNTTGQNNLVVPASSQYFGRLAIVSTTTNTGTVTDNGLLVTLQVSTVGLDANNTPSFQINLLGTFNGDSDLVPPNGIKLIPLYTHNLFSIGNAQRMWTFGGGGTWNLDSNWSPFAPYAAGDPANFLSAITTSSTITLDGDRTVGSILFNNAAASYTLSQGSGGTLFLDNGAAAPFITDSGGNHTINVPLSLARDTNVTVTRAGDVLTLSGPLSAPATNLTLNGLGTLLLGGSNSQSIGQITGTGNLLVDTPTSLSSEGIRINNLQINGNISIRPNTGATSSGFTAGVTVVNSLTLAGSGPSSWTGKLDLNNNALIINTTGFTGNEATVLSTLVSQVSEARNGTTNNWTGVGGITSSTVKNGDHTDIGGISLAVVALADLPNLTNLTTYRGQTITSSSVMVVAARTGDVTLDGHIDISDLNAVTSHWQQTGAIWSQGDTTGTTGSPDGKVDISDLNAVTSQWQFTVGIPVAPGGAPGIGGGGAVPEPASLAMLALGGAALVTRRRRR